jgi:glycosyltransferase involved in cell wall biosynthesis
MKKRHVALTVPGCLSVVLPVYNAGEALNRVIRSLIEQRFENWELVVVDDGSTDGSARCLTDWTNRDGRVRVIRRLRRRGIGGAINAGTLNSWGDTIVHLDCNTELDPSCLARVASQRHCAEVLLWGYQVLCSGSDCGFEAYQYPDPVEYRNRLFLFRGGLPSPLGLAHKRELLQRAGGINEYLLFDEIGELWKRLARAGAAFCWLPFTAGVYHLPARHPKTLPSPLRRQRLHAERNHRAEKPLYCDAKLPRVSHKPVRSVVYAGCHSIIDSSSGAAVATMDTLQLLTSIGFKCQAFCTPLRDTDDEVCFEDVVAGVAQSHSLVPSICRSHHANLLFARCKQVPVTFIRFRSTRHDRVGPDELFAALSFFDRFLLANRPDVVLTYGCDPISKGMVALAKRRDIPIVFAIHNFAYKDPRHFLAVDYCTVPSQFAREFYWTQVGVSARAMPNPVSWDRVQAHRREPKFVTFVNPSLEKGVYAFARIAEELERRRPDIPLLVVEARGTRDTLAACWPDGHVQGNVTVLRNTPDPRQFWGQTRIALVPSLWWENQPAVAYEAMINGVPVVGSDRGGIPEALGDSGFALPLPKRLTPRSRVVPTPQEVEPWVDTIVRLWDDQAHYRDQSAKSLNEARRWHPDLLGPLYSDFYRNIHPQPGPPVLPR